MSFIYVPPTASVGQSNLTAATALTAGQAVAVNSSGQAAAVSGYAQGTGSTGLVTNSGNTTQATWGTCSAYDTVNQRLVVFYQKPTTGDYYCKVGTLTSGTWTFGTEVLVIANTGSITTSNVSSAIYNAAAGKIMFSTMFANTSISVIAGTVSGTSITFGTKVTYVPTSSVITTYSAIIYDDLTGQAILGWNANPAPYCVQMVLSISGTTITTNTEYGLSNFYNVFNIMAGNGYTVSPIDGQSFCIFTTISGTTLTNITRLTTGSSNTTSYVSLYIPSLLTYHFVATSGTSVYINGFKYTGGGGVTNPTSFQALTSGLFDFTTYAKPAALSYDTSTSYLAMTWTPPGATSTMQTSLYTISTTTLTAVTQFNALNTTTKSAYNQTISLNNGSLIYSFRDVSTGYTYSNPLYETTNTNYTGFIGFSSAAYGIGATATILTDGAITTSQSGLTPGLKYYVQPDGTLTTTLGSNQFAGHALSATSLLILG